MSKKFKMYALIWVILLAIINIIIFAVRPIIPEFEAVYDARFWIAWVLIHAMLVVNLICAKTAFKSENLKKMFYNISLIYVSYIGVIVMCIASAVVMLIPNCPAWIAVIVCAVIAVWNLISVIKTCWAIETVEAVDEKVNDSTSFIKTLTVDAENLMLQAKNESIKAECKKVYEAIRYSDPMSSGALASIESSITIRFAELCEAVKTDNIEKVEKLSNEVFILISDRNKKGKFLK